MTLHEVTVHCENSECFAVPDCVYIKFAVGEGDAAQLTYLACEMGDNLAQTLLRVDVADEDGEVTAHDYLDHTTLWLTSGQLTELVSYWFRENVATTDPDDDGDWPLSVSTTWQSAPGRASFGRINFTHHADTHRRDLIASELPLPPEWAPTCLAPTGETLTRVVCPAPFDATYTFICAAVGAVTGEF